MEKRCFIKFDSLMKDTLTNDNFKSEEKKKKQKWNSFIWQDIKQILIFLWLMDKNEISF